MDNIEKLREIFLAEDVDSEDYEDNLRDLNELESRYRENENLLEWQQHALTQAVVKQAKEGRLEIALRLANDRELSNEQRASLFAKQDAMDWILNLASADPQKELENLDKEIENGLNRV